MDGAEVGAKGPRPSGTPPLSLCIGECIDGSICVQ